MKLTSRVLRAAAVTGVATVAPLIAGMPAHAGLGVSQGPAATEWPPGPGATDSPPGLGVGAFPPGPSADVIGPEI